MLTHLKFKCPNPENSFTAARMATLGNSQTKIYQQTSLNVDGNSTTSGGFKCMSFTQENGRKSLARMIVIDELPFSTVEGEGFRAYSYYLEPRFIMPSRITVARDVMDLYEEEKAKVKKILRNQRLCFTTDSWTSIQNLCYMCLTAHWIDDNWNYQKRILNFCPISSHKGESIGKAIESCLADWGIERILTITLDNASANHSAIKFLKRRKGGYQFKNLISDHAFLHVRCSAHILNLIVQSGLSSKVMNESIDRIRGAVKYVRSSPARTQAFDCSVKAVNIDCKKKLILDVATRWNSTYLMLETAVKYERAFDRLSEDDVKYVNYFSGGDELDACDVDDDSCEGRSRRGLLGPPRDDDWENARCMIKFLKFFYNATLKFSSSTSVTSNDLFHEVAQLSGMLKKLGRSENCMLSSMASRMNMKFIKYWGDFDGINGLLYVAVVLDPRYKMMYMKVGLASMFGENLGDAYFLKLEGMLKALYEQYAEKSQKVSVGSSCSKSSDVVSENISDDDDDDDYVDVRTMWQKHQIEEHNLDNNSDFVRYFRDNVEVVIPGQPFNVLHWWQLNSTKYPIMAQIARDVLAVPVSSVASESAFSTGGRILDPYRSSLRPLTVEALVCTQNWLRSSPTVIDSGVLPMVDPFDEIELCKFLP